MSIFKTPSEVLYGQLTKPQVSTINFIKDKIKHQDFIFYAPYQHRANFQILKSLLAESGWVLSENQSGSAYTWTLTPSL